MKRALAAITLLTITAACSSQPDEAPVAAVDAETGREFRKYPAFPEVDQYASLYFVTLEPSGLIESQGPERLYGLGVNVCTRLDAGQTVAENMADDAGLGTAWGQVVGAAVSGICSQHGQAVEEYLAANS